MIEFLLGDVRRPGGARRRGVAGRMGVAVLALSVLAGCAKPETETIGLRLSSSDALQAESGLGGYLAGRFAARALRDTTRAADYLAQALAEDPDNEVLTHRTMQLMLADGRIEEGRKLAQKVVRFAPGDSLANLVLSIESLRTGDATGAMRRMSEIGRTGFNVLISPIVIAWCRQADGQPDAAIEALSPLKENAAFNGFRLFHTALIADLNGRIEAADKAYKETMTETGGSSLRVVEAYGSFLSRYGRIAEARKVYAEYLTRNPENPGIIDQMTRLERGELPSRPMVASAVEGVAEALYGTAIVLSRNDRTDSGEIYVHMALYLRPDFVLSRSLLGDLHEGDNRWEEAIKVYQGIDRSSPYSWATRLRIAWAFTRLDRKEEAYELLRAMSDEDAKRSDALITLGDLLRNDERFAEAADAYSRAIGRVERMEQRHWAMFYARGIAYERSKQWSKAEADLLKALELKPDDPLVLNYLGYSWVEQGVNIEKAREMIERAVKQRPNDGYIVDSLGWVLYRIGRYREAVVQLERAVELRPEDPTINDHLGDAYWKAGRKAEARFQWRRALSLKPEAAQVPVIEGKLATGLANDVPAKSNAAKRGG